MLAAPCRSFATLLTNMSLPHFYLDEQMIASEASETFVLRLAEDDTKHARVLRLAPGEHIAVVDAAQDYFECEVVSFNDALPVVRIAQHLENNTAVPQVVLVQGLAKGDKMETVIRHATELGVREFVPCAFARCIVKLNDKKATIKTERWRSIAKSAAMQSGQQRIPQVHEPKGLSEVCEFLSNMSAVLVCWEEAPNVATIADALAPALLQASATHSPMRVAVVVGPEGGLTAREVEILLGSGTHTSLVSLGSSILRTETAGIVAPALVLYELGGLGRTTHANAQEEAE